MAAHQIIRSLYTAQWCLLARVPRRANPGLGYQLQQLQQPSVEDASEDYADMEADFMSAHRTHQQHEAQQQQQRDRVRQFMIKHKYFRNAKLPNLLLYAEKEQMRLLHERDADEWSVERLAESFPATADIVQKVLRSRWRPQSVERIRNHDASVMRNWTQLRAGKCADVPPELMQHLQKFAQRQRGDLQQLRPEQWPTRPELPVPQRNEFRALLGKEGNKQLESGNSTQRLTARFMPPAAGEEETYLLDKVVDKRKMRLQELKALQVLPKQKEQQLERPLPNPNGTGPLPSFVEKFERTEIVVSVADQRKYEMSKVKDRIVIPRKLYQQGATYRVDDAYYDDDGELLYRVPGMTGGQRFHKD
ncbi:neugrin [Drosophila grimshawi]|uniref:GH18229 n=1 Tax=Drosophila grimshawi TaxID=7222 RepID=B4JFQ5_DROGR|nr:neugrin [Drosophila grimshawi]EDV93536.1 GH18229 [Drosophila grimshawi]